ncbi:MAG: hypothetical protein QXR89_04875 [Candidatus Bathyarchaeia archaeon]
MPAISIDTFFACSLMVLLVLSAMAATASLLYQPISNSFGNEAFTRYGEIAKYMLLNTGEPADWGKNSQTFPEEFGLADVEAANPYTLDIDKVSRLNGENLHALSYAQIYTSLKIPDIAFRIEIKPLFETVINLTATYEDENETTYEFEIETVRSGVNVPAELRLYTIAESLLQNLGAYSSDGEIRLNVTIPNSVNGPALLVVLAKSKYNAKIVSFAVYAFAHTPQNPMSKGSFLRLSPLNHTLTVVPNNPDIVLLDVYALTFNNSSTLEKTTSQNQAVTFNIPKFLDASPIMLVATGRNSTQFFVEWTVYPQIPVAIGISPTDSISLADVYAYTYLVTINSALYKCTVWLGGPKQ